jgi:hypothetical protein
MNLTPIYFYLISTYLNESTHDMLFLFNFNKSKTWQQMLINFLDVIFTETPFNDSGDARYVQADGQMELFLISTLVDWESK